MDNFLESSISILFLFFWAFKLFFKDKEFLNLHLMTFEASPFNLEIFLFLDFVFVVEVMFLYL